MLKVLQLPVLTDNYIYLLHDPVSKQTAVIDPALAKPVLDALHNNGWQLTTILNTHHHADHVGGNLELKNITHCQIFGSAADKDRIPGLDHGVNENDIINIGQHTAKVISTPGHTDHHIAFHFAKESWLFCGDTLFSMGCGRLFEGSAEQLWQSIQKFKLLPGDTQIYCTHEYTEANGRFALTLEPNNPQLQQRMEQVAQLRAKNQPTIPTSLQLELETNPFLRESSLALQQTIGMTQGTATEIFAKVRQLKDTFR
ncbi:MAG: hydroxyacylglutathione hydrolase [Methylococcaceae bacterium]|jgi:hydroxyacylglutathione hydrolase